MEHGSPVSADVESPVDFDPICARVRGAFEALRVHAVSLHDHAGEVLWMTESSMGPDEHNAVREAFETFVSPTGRPIFAYDLGDSRSAVLFRAVDTRRIMMGAVMIIVDTRGIQQDEKGLTRLMTVKMQRVLTEFAASRPPGAKSAPIAATSVAAAVIPAKTVATNSTPNPNKPPPPTIATPPEATPERANAQALTVAASTAVLAPARPAPVTPVAGVDFPLELSLAETMSVPRPVIDVATIEAPRKVAAAAAAAPAAAAPPRAAPPQAAPPRAAPPITAPPQAAPPKVTPDTARKPSPPPAVKPSPPATPAPKLVAVTPIPIAASPLAADPLAADPPPKVRAPGAAHPERRAAPRPVPDVDRLQAAMRRSPLALNLQRLVPLAKGSQLRRYEVLLRSAAEDAPNAAPQAMLQAAVDHGLGSMIDRRVVTQLVEWLVRHPQAWRSQAIMLSVNLTSTALEDEHFTQFLGLCLEKSSLPKAMIAFEIDVPAVIHMPDRVAAMAAALQRLGCPLVLDNFALRTECFDLLRLPAVRYVKLALEITTMMRTDKIAQAAITAVVQMARVLGMHTVAKRTESAAEQEWLTALGVDFVQSNALAPAVSIDTLLG